MSKPLEIYGLPAEIVDCWDEENQTYDLDQLSKIQMQVSEKGAACAAAIKNLDAELTAIKTEMQRLRGRAARIEEACDNFKVDLLVKMQIAGIKEAGDTLHKLRVVKSQSSVKVNSEDTVPAQFKTEEITVKVDRREILKWFKETGEEVEGVTIETENVHLRVS